MFTDYINSFRTPSMVLCAFLFETIYVATAAASPTDSILEVTTKHLRTRRANVSTIKMFTGTVHEEAFRTLLRGGNWKDHFQAVYPSDGSLAKISGNRLSVKKLGARPGDVIQLVRQTASGKKKVLHLVYLERGAFPHILKQKKRWTADFFAYGYLTGSKHVKRMQYNTFPPRLTKELVKYVFERRKEEESPDDADWCKGMLNGAESLRYDKPMDPKHGHWWCITRLYDERVYKYYYYYSGFWRDGAKFRILRRASPLEGKRGDIIAINLADHLRGQAFTVSNLRGGSLANILGNASPQTSNAGRYYLIPDVRNSSRGQFSPADAALSEISMNVRFTDSSGRPASETVRVLVRDTYLELNFRHAYPNATAFRIVGNPTRCTIAPIMEGGTEAQRQDATRRFFAKTGILYLQPDWNGLADWNALDNTRSDDDYSIAARIIATLEPGQREITWKADLLDTGFDSSGTGRPRVRVHYGYSRFQLDGGVGRGTSAENRRLDVYRVQQRLRYLGFRGEKRTQHAYPPAITVDGRISGGTSFTVEAINLFEANLYTGFDGYRGQIANGAPGTTQSLRVNGPRRTYSPQLVLPNDATWSWLNAINAPRWIDLSQILDGNGNRRAAPRYESNLLRTLVDRECWCLSWTRDIMMKAHRALARGNRPQGLYFRQTRRGLGPRGDVTSLCEFPDAWPTRHHEHHNGHVLDVGYSTGGHPTQAAFPGLPSRSHFEPPWPFTQQQIARRHLYVGRLEPRTREIFYLISALNQSATANEHFYVGGSQARLLGLRQVLGLHEIRSRSVPGHDDHLHVRFLPPDRGELVERDEDD